MRMWFALSTRSCMWSSESFCAILATILWTMDLWNDDGLLWCRWMDKRDAVTVVIGVTIAMTLWWLGTMRVLKSRLFFFAPRWHEFCFAKGRGKFHFRERAGVRSNDDDGKWQLTRTDGDISSKMFLVENHDLFTEKRCVTVWRHRESNKIKEIEGVIDWSKEPGKKSLRSRTFLVFHSISGGRSDDRRASRQTIGTVCPSSVIIFSDYIQTWYACDIGRKRVLEFASFFKYSGYNCDTTHKWRHSWYKVARNFYKRNVEGILIGCHLNTLQTAGVVRQLRQQRFSKEINITTARSNDKTKRKVANTASMEI